MCTYECCEQFFVILFVIILGVLFGILLEPNNNLPDNYKYISAIIGWTYFFSWSISFYPQIIYNYKRKTSKGLSVDFLLFNAIGYLCYSIFTVSMYYIPEFRYTYERKHNGNLIPISINDVCFALHAFIITIITWSQVIYYDGYYQIPSKNVFLLGFCFIVFCSIYILFITQKFHNNNDPWNWYTFIYIIALTKLIVTIIKYLPQIFTNYKMKSTIGFSINQVILDLIGSILSLTQLILDCYYSGDNWSNLLGNPVKLFLSCISIFYDLVLLFQHYVIYVSSRMSAPPEYNMNSSLSFNHSFRNNDGNNDNITYYTTIENAIDNDEESNNNNIINNNSGNIEMQQNKQIVNNNKSIVANWNSNNSISSNHNSFNKYKFTLPNTNKFRNSQFLHHQKLPQQDDDNEEYKF